MRFDKKGNLHTLEQDIVRIWKLHGWDVVEETVPRTRGKIRVWIIKAKPMKRK